MIEFSNGMLEIELSFAMRQTQCSRCDDSLRTDRRDGHGLATDHGHGTMSNALSLARVSSGEREMDNKNERCAI